MTLSSILPHAHITYQNTAPNHITHPNNAGGDEDGREEEQGEHQSHGEQAQLGDEQDQAGVHIKFPILISIHYHQAMEHGSMSCHVIRLVVPRALDG